MLETFNNYCRITLDEIYAASVSNNVVNVEKLLAKVIINIMIIMSINILY